MNLITIEKSTMFHIYLFFNVLFYLCESKLVYNCENGFIQFGNSCYHLSLKTLSWQEAYFECKYMAKGSKLSVLPRELDDFNTRTFLNYRQNETEERWIGGIYDWSQDQWKWAITGRKIRYHNFQKIPHFDNAQDDHWQCIALDPSANYKWTAHSCLQKKHFICETKPRPECK